MKKNLFLIFILLLSSQIVYANAIVEKKNYPSSAIKTSSIVNSSYQNSLLDTETYKSAISELKNKLSKNPKDIGLYINLADLYMKVGDYKSASDNLLYVNSLAKRHSLDIESKSIAQALFDSLRKSQKTDRNKSYYYTNMAILSLILGNNQTASEYLSAVMSSYYDVDYMKGVILEVIDAIENVNSAISICDKVLMKRPTDVSIRKLKATYLVQAGRKEEAIQEYSHILSISPEDKDSIYSMYKLLVSTNTPEKAIMKKLYNTEKPDMEKAYSDLAKILLENNNLDDAIVYAKLLVEKYPNNANGYIFLSELYRRAGKLKESYEILEVVRDKADNNEQIAQYNVLLAKLSDEPLAEANSLMANGLYKEALEVLESAAPENLYVILAQSRANYYLNKKQQALDLLNKAMTLYPNNSDVYCAFAYIYLQEKDIDSARRYVNHSLKINSDNKTALTLLDLVNAAETKKYHNEILTNIDTENYKEADRLISEALKINSKDSMLYYFKGLSYIAQANYAASTSVLYKCLEYDKTNLQAIFYLGFAFDNLDEKENALNYYEMFVNKLPKDDFGESERLNYAKSRIEKLRRY